MKKKILLLVILVIILLAGGVAYAYYATDLFKTDKEMFFSYLTDEKLETNLNSEKLLEYYEKQANTPYESKGEISFNTSEYGESNEAKIIFNGKTVNPQKAFEQEVTLDLSQGYNIPINVKRDGDTFGIQADILGESKYIAIRNENLKELAERFGLDSEYIPEKIEYNTFTEEELNQLASKYYAFFNEKLTDDMFSKEKVDKQTVIKLNLSAEQFTNILTELLNTINEDEILNSKLPETYKETLKNVTQELEEDLKSETYSSEDNFEMRIYIEKRKAKKLEVKFLEGTNESVNMIAEFAENAISLKCYVEGEMVLEEAISMQTNENDVTYLINCKEYEGTDEEVAEINMELTYKNLMELDNVEEDFNIDVIQKNATTYSSDYYYEYYDGYLEDTTMNIHYSNQKTFSQDLALDAIDENNAIIINDTTDEELQNLIYNIYESLGLI